MYHYLIYVLLALVNVICLLYIREYLRKSKQQKVIDKIIKITENKNDRILLVYILSSRSDYMTTLTLLLNNDSTFKNMIEKILEEACNDSNKVNDNNNTSREFLETLEIIKKLTDNNQLTTDRQMFNKVIAHYNPKISFLNLQQFLRILTPEQRTKIISSMISLSSKLPSNILPPHLTHTITWVKNVGVKISPVYIAAGILALETLKCVYDWWNGSITGIRCATIFVERSAAVVGGFLGAQLGMAIGTMALPIPIVGTLVGAVAGGFIGATLFETLVKCLIDNFFDLPKDIAVENAYAFLKVKHTCTNLEVNEAYRKLLLIYHPDKGGSKEKFCKLQASLAIISKARGQDLSTVKQIKALSY